MRLVEEYASLGDHRTGTSVDRLSRDWLGTHLENLGAEVEFAEYHFPRFAGSWHLSRDGREVETLPLFYQGTGFADGVRPALAQVDVEGDEATLDIDLEAAIGLAQKQGFRALIIATRSATDGLTALNRSPSRASDFPVFLVSGDQAAGMEDAAWRLRYDLKIEDACSANVIGRFPAPDQGKDDAPWVITTPLSGWFRCAGERGTGLAVSLYVSRQLAHRGPLWLVAPTGHELGFFGAYAFLEEFAGPAKGVLHIGSCVASKGQSLRVVADLPPSGFRRVAAAAEPLGVVPERPADPNDPASWWGEAECWAPRGQPMVSIAGMAPHFHTPQDLPGSATSPRLLVTSATAIIHMGRALLES